MSLPITFHRAASAEFIEASAWYESKRFGLALEFMAEIDRCISLASDIRSSIPLFAMTFGASSPIVFRTSFIFARRNIESLYWRYFMAAGILLFGGLEPNPTLKRSAQQHDFSTIGHYRARLILRWAS